MSIPTLSVCIPTYNSSAYLAETLDSLVSQFDDKDVFNWVEIVISDNASPDDTTSVVKRYQARYPNIKYTRNHINLWGAVNIIKVTEWASAKHLWLLTDNDSSSKFALWYVLRIIEETNFDVMLWNFLISTPEKLLKFHEEFKGYHKFNGIWELGDFFGNQIDMPLHSFGSNFSLYSIFFVKKEYFDFSRNTLDKKRLSTHFFPHSLITYANIEDKIIIKPNNIFTLPMWHPSSWSHSANLYNHFHEVFLSFMYSKKITPKFMKKIRRFLIWYWIINYTMIIIDPFPFVWNTLKALMKKSNLFKKLINSVLNPDI